MIDKEHLRRNLDEVIWQIEQARIAVSERHIVKLVAVGKYSDIESIETLYSLGQRAYGENQVQQLDERSRALEALPLEWHFIGRLQKNKINKLIDIKPNLMQSLDSLELALALNDALERKGGDMHCLMQINSAAEESKTGLSVESAFDTYQEIMERCPHIRLKGVMSIGAHTEDRRVIEESFEKTYKIFESLQKSGATICSMGMSGDYSLAIRCGSNLVRIGSVLFGR